MDDAAYEKKWEELRKLIRESNYPEEFKKMGAVARMKQVEMLSRHTQSVKP